MTKGNPKKVLEKIVEIVERTKNDLLKADELVTQRITTGSFTTQRYEHISKPLVIHRAYERIQKLLEQNKYL